MHTIKFAAALGIGFLLIVFWAGGAQGATMLVTNRDDSGLNTLRAAVVASNTTTGQDTIVFALTTSVTVFTPLAITDPVIVDGGGSQVVGALGTTIFAFNAGSQGSTLENIAVVDAWTGVALFSNMNHVIGCRIGTDWSNVAGRGNSIGIFTNGVNNDIGGTTAGERNIISGNTKSGIWAAAAWGTQVRGNYIGTNSTGTAALANAIGVTLKDGTGCSMVGGNSGANEGNLISGNTAGAGVNLVGASTSGNSICGNVIGLNLAQNAALANQDGVYIQMSANNAVGLPVTGYGNILTGNSRCGVETTGPPYARMITIQNNFIGMNAAGTTSFPSQWGVFLNLGDCCLIGGYRDASHPLERNVISGHTVTGVRAGGNGNTICGNFIGTNAAGNAAIPNYNGVLIQGNGNLVGGPNTDSTHVLGNVISGNYVVGQTSWGVNLVSGKNNTIQGNIIGLNANQDAALPNAEGIHASGASNTYDLIGGNSPDYRNVIGGNNSYGIYLNAVRFFTIAGNYIGLNSTDNTEFSNGQMAICLQNNASSCLIGGIDSGSKNIICGNTTWGVGLSSSSGNTLVGNWLSLFPDQSDVPQEFVNAIYLEAGASSNLIGLKGAGQGNLIRRNGYAITLVGAATDSNGIFGNTICGFSIEPGIHLNGDGSNNDKAAPNITLADTGLVMGNGAQPGDTIEVFKAARGLSNQGGSLLWVGAGVADGSGNWTLYPSGLNGGDFACAIATDTQNNSSGFSNNVSVSAVIPTPTKTASPTATSSATPVVTPTPSATPRATSTTTPTPTQSTAQLNSFLGAESVRAFPNPGRGKVNFAVKVEKSGTVRIDVYNLHGEHVAAVQGFFNPGIAQLVWNCPTVAPGVYLARIRLDSTEVKKIKVAIIH